MIHFQGSYVSGLVDRAVEWFPELSPELGAAAKEALPSGYKNACMAYESAMAHIATACSCLNHSSNADGKLEYCLVVVVQLVLFVCQSMSAIVVDKDLGPTRHGIDMMYSQIQQRRYGTAVTKLLFV